MGEVLDLVPAGGGHQLAKREDVFLPIMSMEVALQRRSTIVDFVKKIMHADQDFGVIPGTNKPTLLKPGAEKLCNFFGLEPEFTPIVEDCDWTGDLHKGEPFYYVRYRARLMREGRVLGVGEGSCNSWESRYRWRMANRKCPQCGAEAIIAGKAEYGGGWVCFKKKSGCGAKFETNDAAITGQQVGRVPNPDVADVVNTIQKMAQKRALVAATLIATSASEFFTQDVEDGDTNGIDTGGHAVGTQAAQDHVRDQKIQGARQAPAGPTAGNGSGPAVPPIAAAPVKAEPAERTTEVVPEELIKVWELLDKPGGQRTAFSMVKNELMAVLPQSGGVEYHRLLSKHGIKPNGNLLKSVQKCLLEMWALITWARAQEEVAQKAVSDGPNDDIPPAISENLFGDQKPEVPYGAN